MQAQTLLLKDRANWTWMQTHSLWVGVVTHLTCEKAVYTDVLNAPQRSTAHFIWWVREMVKMVMAKLWVWWMKQKTVYRKKAIKGTVSYKQFTFKTGRHWTLIFPIFYFSLGRQIFVKIYDLVYVAIKKRDSGVIHYVNLDKYVLAVIMMAQPIKMKHYYTYHIIL